VVLFKYLMNQTTGKKKQKHPMLKRLNYIDYPTKLAIAKAYLERCICRHKAKVLLQRLAHRMEKAMDFQVDRVAKKLEDVKARQLLIEKLLFLGVELPQEEAAAQAEA